MVLDCSSRGIKEYMSRNSSFKDELTALFKKHGITSTSMLCYNDPDEVAKYNEELRVYNEQLDSWKTKYSEWIKANPEVPRPSRYIGYGAGARANRNYDRELNAYNDWETKMEAEIGPEPQEPDYDLVKEEYDEEYTPGVWYSSRC